jgi:hypothetical protein
MAYQVYTGIRVALHYICCSIGGTIVDYNNFEVLELLFQAAIEATGDQIRSIEYWHDDAKKGRFRRISPLDCQQPRSACLAGLIGSS